MDGDKHLLCRISFTSWTPDISGDCKTDLCRGRGIDLMNCEDPIHCQKVMSLRMMNRDNSVYVKESKSGVRSVTLVVRYCSILLAMTSFSIEPWLSCFHSSFSNCEVSFLICSLDNHVCPAKCWLSALLGKLNTLLFEMPMLPKSVQGTFFYIESMLHPLAYPCSGVS